MKTNKKKFGFTIVELLTVMSIIAILMGLLVPALTMVRRIAKDTRQKAQFHAIDVAMEAYHSEMEQYPPSGTLPDPNISLIPPVTVGAQHLAEALVGRDMLGFDTWSTWDSLADETKPDVYAAIAPSPKNSTQIQVDASLDRRKGPYLNPESVEAFQLAQLYPIARLTNVYPGDYDNTGNLVAPLRDPAPVLTDAYRIKTISLPNKRQVKAGTPILYYRANVTSRFFRNAVLPVASAGALTPVDATRSIFNSLDNEELIKLGTVADQTKKHNFDPTITYGTFTGREKFYETITNSKITTQVRPYNQSTYILISAGFDGIFGTPDDIYNYNE